VALGLQEGTWAHARARPDADLGEWNDRLLRELERGVSISIEGAGGTPIRVGEIPDLAGAIGLWLAHGNAIDVGLVDQDPPEQSANSWVRQRSPKWAHFQEL
jgi:hypothetical protein